MDISKLSIGKNPPEDVNVVIENPMGGFPVKYELDKDTGFINVDRFIHSPMHYPGNYGFIPHTLSDDGDPADCLVIGLLPVIPGSVLRAKPVGVLIMEDESGQDEKIIARPVDKLFPYHANVNDLDDVQPILKDQIAHFFTHYKDLEKGKWVKVSGWGDAAKAGQIITEAIEREKAQKNAA